MWTLTSTDPKLLSDIKVFEGTMAYQSKLGYYKNGKFWVYKDSLNKNTIGYGHLVLINENFSAGLTETQADALLSKDLARTVADAKSIYDQYKMTGPIEVQHVLTQMCFQLGKDGVLQFNNTLKAMAKGDYAGTIAGMKNSLWFKQTPNRVNGLIQILQKI